MAADLTIIQGDSFPPDYPVYLYSAVDKNGVALDLKNREFRVTFRPAPVSEATDASDAGADVAIKGTLIVDGTGTATTQTNLYMVGASSAGTFALVLDSTTTGAMPLDTVLQSDVQMTVRNYFGAGWDLVRTVTFPDTLAATSGYTNRFTG